MESAIKVQAVNRFAIFANRVHLMNGGVESYRGSAETQEEAIELAIDIAKKSRESEFFSWLQIFDRVTEKYTEYSITLDGSLKERERSQ
ncbi:hypothetical protein ACJJIK_03670 [Microbulbifer sp. ZKSA006]|uniref:hypothetical protein n=1 Tax=Microbulbifer sp. ZKSA006 TaxID=3243390 RepID=UPI00403A46B0